MDIRVIRVEKVELFNKYITVIFGEEVADRIINADTPDKLIKELESLSVDELLLALLRIDKIYEMSLSFFLLLQSIASREGGLDG